MTIENNLEAQQESIKPLRIKIDQLDDVFEKTRGDMDRIISNLEASLIARVNSASKDFQTQINTVLQQRLY
jgi:hypothetical protein